MKISGYRLDEIMAERRHIGPVCAAAQGLYAELCRQYNKFPDPAGFECDNGFLMVAMGNCSINSLKKYREQLVAAGLIDYLSRQEEKKAGIYRMLNLGKAGLPCSNIEHEGSTTSNIEHEGSTTSNIEHEESAACSNFEHGKGCTCSNFEHATTPATSNIEHAEPETGTPACSKFEHAHVQILNTTLNKSKLGSTNVLPLSLKGSDDFEVPKIPAVTDPFEAFELPPAAPPFCAPPPQAEMPAENPPAAPAKKSKGQPRSVFQKPTLEELENYFAGRKPEWPAATCKDEAETFHDHFTSNGWKVGTAKAPMQDWQASVRNWLRRNFSNAHAKNSNPAGGQSAGGNSKPSGTPQTRGRGSSIADLQALKRNRNPDSEERTEFTEATIVE